MRRLNFLYILGPLSLSRWDNNELRYSLRSIERAFDVDWVGISGPELPPFLKDIQHIKNAPQLSKAGNAVMQILAACKDERVPEELILMNDDFIVRDAPTWDWTPTTLGPLKKIESANTWRRSVNDTFDWLVARGIKNPTSYENHTPMPFLKSPALLILEGMVKHNLPLQFRSAYGNIMHIGGRQHPNGKRRLPNPWPVDSPFWSLKSHVEPRAKQFLQTWFKEPSRWEV